MTPFAGEPSALTTILVVSDLQRAKSWYLNVLGADLYGEYGGTSVVLSFLGAWLLLVTGAGPTEDKPTVAFTEPTDPDVSTMRSRSVSPIATRRTRIFVRAAPSSSRNRTNVARRPDASFEIPTDTSSRSVRFVDPPHRPSF